MPDEKNPRHPETNFLPPLDMVLTFFDRIVSQREEKQKLSITIKEEKKVEKFIEKLNEKDKS